MWNKEQADSMLKELAIGKKKDMAKNMQQATDLQKYYASIEEGFDLCGNYGGFCAYCDKEQENPCANAYLKMCKEKDETEKVSLSESLKALSKVKTDASINKKSIAKYLADAYGDSVVINQRENNIKGSHLPLPDTHFTKGVKKNICFTYVYENKQGKILLLVNTTEKVAKKIKADHKNVKPSKFPKSKNTVWLSVPIDESFATKDVYSLLDMLIDALRK